MLFIILCVILQLHKQYTYLKREFLMISQTGFYREDILLSTICVEYNSNRICPSHTQPFQVQETKSLTDPLQQRRRRELTARYYEQCSEINSSILIRLSIKTFLIPTMYTMQCSVINTTGYSGSSHHCGAYIPSLKGHNICNTHTHTHV